MRVGVWPAAAACLLTLAVPARASAAVVTRSAPTDGQAYVDRGTTVTASFDSAIDASTLTPSSFTLTGPAGAVPATVVYDAASATATLRPASTLAGGDVYTARLDDTVHGADGSTLPATSWSFVTAACPCSLHRPAATPAIASAPVRDGRPLPGPWTYELGVRLTVDVPLLLTRVRFWKSPGETGPHVGTVWSDTGTPLEQATFAAESASGWQEQPLPLPLTLEPGRAYTVSVGVAAYFPATHYGLAPPLVTGPLRSAAAPNGVYGEHAGDDPTSTFESNDYFVDAVVEPAAPPPPPAIADEAPAAGATGVGRDAAVTIRFARPLDPATVDATTFTLTGPSGAVAASVSYDDATSTARLTPSAPLDYSTTYAAAVTSGMRGSDGTPVAPASWKFTVAQAVPPAVVARTPAPGATGVSTRTTVRAQFSKALDPSTLTPSTFMLTGPAGPVDAAVTYDATTLTAVLTPSAPLAGATTYTATLAAAIHAADDAPLGSDVSWTFTTPDPPAVTSVWPARGAAEVAATATVSAVFSRPLDPSSVDASGFTLTGADGAPVDATVTYDAGAALVRLEPAAPLRAGLAYTARIGTSVDAADGTALAAPVSWTFTVSTCPCSIHAATSVPASLDLSTQDGRSGTGPFTYELGVKLRVSAPLLLTRIRFYKTPLETGTHVGTVWTASGNELTQVTFASETASGWQEQALAEPLPLAADTTYVVSVNADAYFAETPSGLATALASGPLATVADGDNGVFASAAGIFPSSTYKSADYFVDAVVAPDDDTGPPTVKVATPSAGATGVAPTSPVVITFAHAVDDATLNADTLTLAAADGSPVAASVSYDPATLTATLAPAAPLVDSASYTVTLSTGVRAANETPLASPLRWTFTVSGAAGGRWSAPFAWPIVPVHMILLPNGKILAIDAWEHAANTQQLYDPVAGTFMNVPFDRDEFCGGHVVLADGEAFLVGGDQGAYKGLADGTTYDFRTSAWTRHADMARSRWYPTATTLPDGRVLVVSGDDITRSTSGKPPALLDTSNTLPEVYDPKAGTWTQLTSAQLAMPLYPFMFVLPDGRVLDAGPDTVTRVLDVGAGTWTTIGRSPFDGGSAVMYEPGKVMKTGTWGAPGLPGLPVSGRTAVLDMTQPSPAWRETGPMNVARAHAALTILPDGTVLATGGSSNSGGTDPATAVYPAELWNPQTETWTRLSSLQVPRMYHSTALLLPDGRVLVAGGGRWGTATDEPSGEIFTPPYLLKGGTRPAITSTPASVVYGSSFDVATPDASRIAKVTLVRPGAETHSFNQEQRFLSLTFRQTPTGLSVDAPASANLAAPGYYMLFLVDTDGVPSVARFVHLPAPGDDVTAPTAPATLTAAGGTSTASLSWSAASDDVGVATYDVYRSTVSGFAANDSTRIAQTASTSYDDSGLAPGRYYYVVRAEDAAPNVGPASPEASASVALDTMPPTVSLTAPAAARAVISVTATASDDVGVVGVQLRLDGQPLGKKLEVAPWSYEWDTTAVPNGAHTLTAVALDAAGNTTTSAPVAVDVDNPALVRVLGTAARADSGGSATIKLAAPVAAGDTVAVFAGISSTGINLSSVTDSEGNAYVLATSAHSSSGVNSFVALGRAATPLAAGDTITITFSASFASVRLAEAVELSGLQGTLDATSSYTYWTGTTLTSGTAPATAAPLELLVGGFGVPGAPATFTPTTGWTALPPVSATLGSVTRTLYQEFRVVGVTGQYAATAAVPAATAFTGAIATIR